MKAGTADEIVLGAAISRTDVDAYTLTVDAANKAGGVIGGGKPYRLALKLYDDQSEQDAATAFDLATTGYVLENGGIVLAGPTAQLRCDPHVKKAYLGL